MAARAGRTGRGSWVFECCSGGPPACRRAGHPARRWSLDSLDPLKSHFSLPFPGTLSHTLSELTEFESNECRGQRGGLSGSGCREGAPGRDRGKCWQGNVTQDRRHGGGILSKERQSGRQSEGQSPQFLWLWLDRALTLAPQNSSRVSHFPSLQTRATG